MQDASDRGTAGSGAGGTKGLHENPYGVTVTTFGRASPIGRCSPVVVRETGGGGIVWNRLDIDCLELSHVSALLVIQGLPLKKLFEGVRFSSPTLQLDGVYTLLRAELSNPLSPPPRLKNVVLAEVLRTGDWPPEEVLGVILKEVFPSPQH